MAALTTMDELPLPPRRAKSPTLRSSWTYSTYSMSFGEPRVTNVCHFRGGNVWASWGVEEVSGSERSRETGWGLNGEEERVAKERPLQIASVTGL